MGKKVNNQKTQKEVLNVSNVSNTKAEKKTITKKNKEEPVAASKFVKEVTKDSSKKAHKEQKKNFSKENTKNVTEKSQPDESDSVQEDKKILNDAEEEATLEAIKERYLKYLEKTKEQLLSKLDKTLIKNAISNVKDIILARYKDNLNLLQSENEEFLYLNFVFGKLPFKFSLRPVNIPLTNSIYDSEKFNTRVCIFVKDPRSAFKELSMYSELPFKVKVIDVKKLKEKYSRFNERRNLLKDYEIFLCDQKIYMLLKKLLGKPFYVQKKYPVALKLDYTKPEEIKNQIVSHVEKSSKFFGGRSVEVRSC